MSQGFKLGLVGGLESWQSPQLAVPCFWQRVMPWPRLVWAKAGALVTVIWAFLCQTLCQILDYTHI